MLGLGLLLASCGGSDPAPDARAQTMIERIARDGASAPRRTLGHLGASAAEPAAATDSTAAADPFEATRFLAWIEYQFPEWFPKGTSRDWSLAWEGQTYTVRTYRNGNNVAVGATGQLYGLGPFTADVLVDYGDGKRFAAQMAADPCVANLSGCMTEELLAQGDEADAEVGVEILRSFKPATITTQVNPAIGGQTVYEMIGTTPKGVPFNAVVLGDEGLDLKGFKGTMRMQARMHIIQGQAVLSGRLIPRNANAKLNPVAFMAAASTARFTGPAAGSVYQVKGSANFKGFCGDDGLSGSYTLTFGEHEVTGALTGVREIGRPLACTPGAVEQAELPVALSYTAVQTHMGVIFSFQGSLNHTNVAAAARSSLLSGGRRTPLQATQVQSTMPAQGLTVSSPTLAPATMRASATLKSNVKELGNTSGAELVSFDASSGTLIFNRLAGNLQSLAVNDIVSSAPRTAAPHGFLRKVTRIGSTSDGKVEVRTGRADVSELLDEADIGFDQPIDATDVQRAMAMEQGRVVYAAAQLPAGSAKPQAIRQSFNLVLFDQDGNHGTTDDQVTVRGNFSFAPRVVVNFQCRQAFCSDPYFLGKFVLHEDAEITVSAKLKKELRESRRIARIPLGVITAGPLVFVPDIVVTVDVEGTVRVEVEVGATQHLDLSAGVEYDGQFHKINDVTTDVGMTGPTFEGSVDLKAGIYGALRLMLYGVAGVSAEAGPYVKFQAQYPGTPAWTMKYGIEGNLGVDIDLLILRKEWDIKLFDKEFDNKTIVAPNERPRFLEIGSKHTCDDGYSARIGVAAAGTGQAPIRLYALTDDKEDGPGTGTIDWSSSLNGPLGRTTRADRHEISANLRNGTHTITAVLSDSGQPAATRTREFIVQLANDRCQFPSGLPYVDITSNDNPLPLVVIDTDRSLTLRARTGMGGGPLCTAITWKSNLERRDAGTSTGVSETVFNGLFPQTVCSHTFTNVYKNLSPQTISARITHNGMTTTDSIDVGAMIPINPFLGDIEFSAPSGRRYIYEGDQVSFSVSGSNPVWSSSVSTDNLDGRLGNTVNARFNSIGQRTIVARIDNGLGGFTSRSVTVNVLSALARP